MSAEEAWAQRAEWAAERGELEIKRVLPTTAIYRYCDAPNCSEPPVKIYEVGPVFHDGGMEIILCAAHADDDLAYELYRKNSEAEAS